MAQKHGCSDSAITSFASRHGWTRSSFPSSQQANTEWVSTVGTSLEESRVARPCPFDVKSANS